MFRTSAKILCLGLIIVTFMPRFGTTSDLLDTINTARGKNPLIIDDLAQKEANNFASALESLKSSITNQVQLEMDQTKFVDASIAVSRDTLDSYKITEHTLILSCKGFIDNLISKQKINPKVFDHAYEGVGFASAEISTEYKLIIVLKRVTQDGLDFWNARFFPANGFPIVEDDELSNLLSSEGDLPQEDGALYNFYEVPCVEANSRSETILQTLKAEFESNVELMMSKACFRVGLHLKGNPGISLKIAVPKRKFYEKAVASFSSAFDKRFDYYPQVKQYLAEFETNRAGSMAQYFATYASSNRNWRGANNAITDAERLLDEVVANAIKDPNILDFMKQSLHQDAYFLCISFVTTDNEFFCEIETPLDMKLSIMTFYAPALFEVNMRRLRQGLDALQYNVDIFNSVLKPPFLFGAHNVHQSGPDAIFAAKAGIESILSSEEPIDETVLSPSFTFVRICCTQLESATSWSVIVEVAHFGFMSNTVHEFAIWNFQLDSELTEMLTIEVFSSSPKDAGLGPNFHLFKTTASRKTVKETFEAFVGTNEFASIVAIHQNSQHRIFGITVGKQGELWEMYCLIPSLLRNLISDSKNDKLTFYPEMGEFINGNKVNPESGDFHVFKTTVPANFNAHLQHLVLPYRSQFEAIKKTDLTKYNSFGTTYRFKGTWEVFVVFWTLKDIVVLEILNNWRPSNDQLIPDPVLIELAEEIQESLSKGTGKFPTRVKYIVLEIKQGLLIDLQSSALAMNTAVEANSKFVGYSYHQNKLVIVFESVYSMAMKVLDRPNLELYPYMNEVDPGKAGNSLSEFSNSTRKSKLSSSNSNTGAGLIIKGMLRNSRSSSSIENKSGTKMDSVFLNFDYNVKMVYNLSQSQIFEEAARQHKTKVPDTYKFVAFHQRIPDNDDDSGVQTIVVTIQFLNATLYPRTISNINNNIRRNELNWIRQDFIFHTQEMIQVHPYSTIEIKEKVIGSPLKDDSAIKAEPGVYKQLSHLLQDINSPFKKAIKDPHLDAIGIWHIDNGYQIKIVFRKFFDDLMRILQVINPDLQVDELLNERAGIVAFQLQGCVQMEKVGNYQVAFTGSVPFTFGSTRGSVLTSFYSNSVDEKTKTLLRTAARIGFYVLRAKNHWKVLALSNGFIPQPSV